MRGILGKRFRFIVAGALISAFSPGYSADGAPGPDWAELAGELNVESSERRSRAITRLKRIGDLDGALRTALGTDRAFLATDVILALARVDLVPDLLRASARPGSHFYFYAALNLLAEIDHRETISRAYVNRLTSSSRTRERAASVVAMLEGLSRWKVALPASARKELLRHRVPDVRNAARRAGKGGKR